MKHIPALFALLLLAPLAVLRANPFGECRMTCGGKPALPTKDVMIALDTQAGEVVEFVWGAISSP